jgi:hypothetical protein
MQKNNDIKNVAPISFDLPTLDSEDQRATPAPHGQYVIRRNADRRSPAL